MKTHKPTEAQSNWLKRIARCPMMKTYVVGDSQPRFSLQDGTTLPPDIAEKLIRNGWVRARRDRLFGAEQSYVPRDMTYDALRPGARP